MTDVNDNTPVIDARPVLQRRRGCGGYDEWSGRVSAHATLDPATVFQATGRSPQATAMVIFAINAASGRDHASLDNTNLDRETTDTYILTLHRG